MSNRTIRTPKKREIFLESLRATGNIRRSCMAAGFSRSSAYLWKEEDADFAADWATAEAEGLENLADEMEQEMRRRAVDGVDEPVFYQGVKCGAVRRYSDSLLMFGLKGIRGDRYRDSQKDSPPPGLPDRKEIALQMLNKLKTEGGLSLDDARRALMALGVDERDLTLQNS